MYSSIKISLSVFTILATIGFCPIARALEIDLKSDTFKQGDTIQVILRETGNNVAGSNSGTGDTSGADGTSGANGTNATDGAALPVVQFHNKTYTAFPFKEPGKSPAGQVGRALIGVNAILPPGTYKLSAGNKERMIKIIPANFGVQVMRLPKSKDNFISSPGEEETVDKAKSLVTPHQFWQGKFLKPSTARTSSAFGLRRRVNGKLLTDYFHSGLDFAGAAGSPVTAPANGRVVISKWGWKLHGNTIAIDHGQGVVSFYIHLSKLLVKEGDMVEAGQKIGLIGSTGRASGPHLHFSLYVNKDATSPWNWFNNAY